MPYYNHYFEAEQSDTASRLIRLKNKKIYKFTSKHLGNQNGAVLELGVGKGYFADICAEEKHEYFGIEASDSACGGLVEKGLHVTQCLVPPIPFESRKFDLVYASHLLEHLPNSEKVYELLKEVYRVLSKDGVLAVVFPNYISMGREFWNCDYTHIYPTTERRIDQLLHDAGFSHIETVRFSGHYADGRRYLVKPLLRIFPYSVLQFLFGWLVNRELIYRGWMYFQEDILMIAKKREEVI